MGRPIRQQDSTRSWKRFATWALGMTLVAMPASAEEDLLAMSLEELMNIEVISASKKA